jgi:hypothetical protein
MQKTTVIVYPSVSFTDWEIGSA